MVSTAVVQEFLAQRRIAVVGVSRDSKQFANSVFRALLERGYEAIPVNPHATSLEGVTAYPSLSAVPGPVDGALFMLPPTALTAAVDDAMRRTDRIPRLWFQSASGPGATPELTQRATAAGFTVIDGSCPFMFLEKAGWFHRFHGTIAHLTGAVRP